MRENLQMKRILALLLMTGVLTTVLVGCETEGQKMQDLEAQEKQADAQRTLRLGAMAYNLDQCYKHLQISELTADDSPKWRQFKKAHHITSAPTAMSDEDLKDCLLVK